jgi:thymidylate synthase
MNKADKYLKEIITEILEEGQWDKEPRTKWTDGTPAHSKFITQKVFQYNISKGEFPINTLRTTALKGAFHDIEAIYIKQTNIVEEMNPSIYSWWKDAIVNIKMKSFGSGVKYSKDLLKILKGEFPKCDLSKDIEENDLGQTYGHTVKRYDLMNKLLKGLEENPFGRRHKMNLWQEQQVIDDPKALEPCAGMTLWSVREEKWVTHNESGSESYSMDIIDFSKTPIEIKPVNIRYIDLTLIQRSQDYLTTVSINPAQYVMLAMKVCNHLTFKTGIKHEVGKLLHPVQNVHIYDRHINSAKEILERESTGLQPKIELVCEPKDFYSHTIEDFKFSGLENIKKLENKLEIAI